MPNHTVKPGDCFNSLAKDYGFFNYQTIYKHANNATVWPNPNQLKEGGSVDIPDKNPKKLPLTLDEQTPFVVDRGKTRLRLSVSDLQGKALEPDSTQLDVGADTSTRKPSNGLIELPINPQETAGALKLTLESSHSWIGDAWRKFKGAVGSIGRSASFDNPPKINDDHFEDEFDGPKDEPVEVTWTLRIGTLEPATEVRGILQRLNNLGFRTPVVTVENDNTAGAVRSWQAFKKKTKEQQTGKVADVRTEVEKTHDQI